jgi:outer membrane protein assembly factor BamB
MRVASFSSSGRGCSFLQRVCLAIAAGIAFLPGLTAEDWAQWRGPTRDGISSESGWSHAWGAAGPKLLWRFEAGTGCSSFTAVGDRVYTMGNRAETDTVYCLDAATGKQLWSYSYPHPLDPNMFEGGPGGSPAIDGSRVYTLSRHGLLLCLEEGKVVWSKDLIKEFGGKQPKWGYAGSPLVLGDQLLLETGGRGASAVALNKLTGELLWKSGDDPASYSSPVVLRPGDNPGVAFLNATGLVVRTAREGRELWRFPWKTQYDVNAACPLVVGESVFLSSGYGHGAALVKLGKAGAELVWQTRAMRNHMNSSVLWREHFYGFDEDSLTCLEAATGSVKWKQAGLGKGSLILADGRLVIMTEKGRLVIAQASPEKFQRLAEAQVLSEKRCWVVPTLSGGRIFCKNNLGEAAAFDVSGK